MRGKDGGKYPWRLRFWGTQLKAIVRVISSGYMKTHKHKNMLVEQSLPVTKKNRFFSFLWRISFFIALWWILTAGASSSWSVGAPVVLLATLASLSILPPIRWSWLGLARFIPFFLWHSLRGGADVAWRVMNPRMPLSPGLVFYRLRLPPGPSRVFMANAINLLPGTLSADLDDDNLCVHTIDATQNHQAELEVLERLVGDLFGGCLKQQQ